MSLSGNTEKINELLSKINALPEETTPSYQEKTVTPSTSAQTVTPDSGYDALSKVTVNAMPTATQATPSIEVSSGGLITAKATQSAGYVAAGTKSATKQLTVQAAQTITPGTADKTIASGRYLTGTQTIKGDSNLVAGNIKKGTSIFGVAGSYEGGGSGSGGGSLATGTLPTMTSYVVTRQNYYVDLENIPGIESKLLVVLRFVNSSYKNPTWILTRSSPGQDFSLSALSGSNAFAYSTVLDGYIFGLTNCTITVGELTYYAA